MEALIGAKAIIRAASKAGRGKRAGDECPSPIKYADREIEHIRGREIPDVVGVALISNRAAVCGRRVLEVVGSEAAHQGVAAGTTNQGIIAIAAEQNVVSGKP